MEDTALSGSNHQPTLTIISLGSGLEMDLTCAASRELTGARHIYLHPSDCLSKLPHLAAQPAGMKTLQGADSEERTGYLLGEIRRHGSSALAVWGDAKADLPFYRQLLDKAQKAGITCTTTAGMSLANAARQVLEIPPDAMLVQATACQLEEMHYPPFAPSAGVLIGGLENLVAADRLIQTLSAVYPLDYPATLVGFPVWGAESVVTLKLAEVKGALVPGQTCLLYLPPVGSERSFEGFQEVIARLRAPDGCAWDRKQTHLSLRPYLLEEAYETLAALDARDMQDLREELGDLLLQILLHAQIAAENGDFNIGDVLCGVNRKIVHRHPHVFGDTKVKGVKDVLVNWQKIKEEERRENGVEEKKGFLDGIPATLPALSQAQEIQNRAATVGFDWPTIDPVIAKVREELEEVLSAESSEQRTGEVGDLLFAVVNLARWCKADAESALRETSLRFRKRFQHIEERAQENGRKLTEMTLSEMDDFWEEAKGLENQ